LFLAFPAIFPSSATSVEKHEKQKKQQRGSDGTIPGREATGLDAAGAAIGSIGLIALCCRRMAAYASSIAVVGDHLRHARLADDLHRDLASAEDAMWAQRRRKSHRIENR
jgi:hypothetical protein